MWQTGSFVWQQCRWAMRMVTPDSFLAKDGFWSMDQFMVDVTEIPDVKKGDQVTLIGRDGDEFISIEEMGDLSGRFSYEFACEISDRVPRVYIKDGKETEKYN